MQHNHIIQESHYFVFYHIVVPFFIIALGYFLCHYCYSCSEELYISVDNVANTSLFVREFLKHQSHITAVPPQHHNYGSLAFELTMLGDNDWEAFVQCASELVSSLKPFITKVIFNMIVPKNFHKLSTNVSTLFRLVESASSLQHLELVCSGGNQCVLAIAESDLVPFFEGNKQLHFFTIKGFNVQISLSALKTFCSAIGQKQYYQTLDTKSLYISPNRPSKDTAVCHTDQ